MMTEQERRIRRDQHTLNRDRARAADLPHFEGPPCKACHTTLRYVRDGNCVACKRAAKARYDARATEAKEAVDRLVCHPDRPRLAPNVTPWIAANMHVLQRRR